VNCAAKRDGVSQKLVLVALFSTIIGLILCVVFAWTFAKARAMLPRMGWGARLWTTARSDQAARNPSAPGERRAVFALLAIGFAISNLVRGPG
jgi:hypothetical protein